MPASCRNDQHVKTQSAEGLGRRRRTRFRLADFQGAGGNQESFQPVGDRGIVLPQVIMTPVAPVQPAAGSLTQSPAEGLTQIGQDIIEIENNRHGTLTTDQGEEVLSLRSLHFSTQQC